MQVVDSHFHLDDFEAEGSVDALLQSAVEAGVERLVAIGGRDSSNALALRVAGEHEGRVYAAVGYDRDVAETNWDPSLAQLREDLASPRAVATGESGLDYHYSADTAVRQRALFEAMLQCAAETGKPIVVHSRDADEDTLAMLAEYCQSWAHTQRPPGVLHCFTGSRAFADALLEIGMMISFSGIVSFRNAAALRDVAAAVPLDRMLIETDAPYLAPVPYRGKRNQPAYVCAVADCLAETRGISVEDVAAATTANAARLFRWASPVAGKVGGEINQGIVR